MGRPAKAKTVRKARAAALAASLGLGLALAGLAQAEPATQLERCQQTLAHVSTRPLVTLEYYPAYLLQRLKQPIPVGDEQELDWCEQTLWAQVDENLKQQPALVNNECRREDRIPQDYRALQTYYQGIPNLACDAGWFIELTPRQWQRLQPMLAELNALEVQCYQGLEALARGGNIRLGQARGLYQVVSLSRKVFQRRWQSLLVELEGMPRQALERRERQLGECEALLQEGLQG